MLFSTLCFLSIAKCNSNIVVLKAKGLLITSVDREILCSAPGHQGPIVGSVLDIIFKATFCFVFFFIFH